jgi:holo-[acyl-carrier protein] synthase
MPILGIGVDLVHVPRIAALLSRRIPEKFAAKILSQEEYSQWETIAPSDERRIRFLAVRYG